MPWRRCGSERGRWMPIPLEDLEEGARELAQTIQEVLPPDVGFVLLLFDFGEDGNLTYLSNAQREDMVKTLKELVAKLEKPRN